MMPGFAEIPMLRLNSRQNDLLETLRRERECSVTVLADKLDVSSETVRRDVRLLAAKGLVVKRHGSVLWPDRRDDHPLHRRMLENIKAKQAIASAVAQEIGDNHSLLIDTGSTNIFVAQALKSRRNLMAITNSAPIAQHLSQSQGSKVYLAGGEVRADDSAAFGQSAISFIEQFTAETAIVSAAAIDAVLGPMDNHLCEAEICQALIRRATRCIMVADHTKFTVNGLVTACAFNDIDLLVTDQAPPRDILDRLEAADVEVLVASENGAA